MSRVLFLTLSTALLWGCGGGASNGVDDADGDGLSTDDEISIYQSDPYDAHDPVPFGDRDLDGDGIPNGADSDYNGDGDFDDDGLTNLWEYQQDLDPTAPEVLVEETRYYSVVTTAYAHFKLSLKTPAGFPVTGAAFSITTDNPALIRAIYPAKGWISDSNGEISGIVQALGTGTSNLYLHHADRSIKTITVRNINSVVNTTSHNPNDTLRSFSSVKNDSPAGTGYARSMLQSSRAWTPASKTSAEWIELPIEAGSRISALQVQGRADAAHWVKTLKISYEISPGVREFAHDGAVFNASSDRNSMSRIPFAAPDGIDRIRIHPVSWFITPALRVALELSNSTGAASIGQDSDADGLNDLLENRMGSDPTSAASPRLYDPIASERLFSSTENDTPPGSDGADGQLDGASWRPESTDSDPWMQFSVPTNSTAVGVRLLGDSGLGQWVSNMRYTDAGDAASLIPLFGGAALDANVDAATALDSWLFDMDTVKKLRLSPDTWEGGIALRSALWIVDPVPQVNDNHHFSDLDGDGLNTLQERARSLDPYNPDTDADGLSDGQEIPLTPAAD